MSTYISQFEDSNEYNEPEISYNNFNSNLNSSKIEQIIEIVLFIQLIFSLSVCIGRSDYNFILYLIGYALFCVELPPVDVNGVIRKITGIRRYLILVIVAIMIDAAWLSFAMSAWLCSSNISLDVCFVEDFQMNWEFKMHKFVIWGSSLNFLLKGVLGLLCWMWINNERVKLETLSPKQF
ncbi:uncharacterized protein CMU_035660 [Cryptosporidium muris RN66]|uniref:Transmembrane protein n=1 Tax=Cryptosporidium muris (strain RN66) TaxID=441375 RepID=B6AGQ2_CRYMR|nr:uncharacterized protein CMU_035660 [Cryptosporidium muris RN66]EEA07393.1 hypothetical protein, conserved [Cryptosporidium muris RN66]|eukprot:XP_002141742.1 hypothetical protein [Cryptosporidium muris RN66]